MNFIKKASGVHQDESLGCFLMYLFHLRIINPEGLLAKYLS